MVTAELAVGILISVMLAAILAWTVNLVALQTRCSDVAAQVVRHAARGDTAAVTAAKQRIPVGASVQLTETVSEVHAVVRLDVSLGRLGPVHLSGDAVLTKEPT